MKTCVTKLGMTPMYLVSQQPLMYLWNKLQSSGTSAASYWCLTEGTKGVLVQQKIWSLSLRGCRSNCRAASVTELKGGCTFNKWPVSCNEWKITQASFGLICVQGQRIVESVPPNTSRERRNTHRRSGSEGASLSLPSKNMPVFKSDSCVSLCALLFFFMVWGDWGKYSRLKKLF